MKISTLMPSSVYEKRKERKTWFFFFFLRKYLEILRDAILVNTYESKRSSLLFMTLYTYKIYLNIYLYKYINIYMYTYICPRYVYKRCGALRNSITHSIFWQPLCFPTPLLTPRRTLWLGLARSSFSFVKKFRGVTRFCLRHSATMYHATWPA